MIVVAYFNYETQRSDIRAFPDEESAKTWLIETWGFVLNGETPSTLKELVYLLHNEYGVIIERLTM